MKEEELYLPLKKYLEHQGYSVSGEVKDCDLAAVKDEEIILIELKTRVTTTLLIQAARRKDICDSVYIAVPVPQGKQSLPNYRGLKNLLQRMEVGLILVRFMKTRTRVEIVLHPRTFEKRVRHKKKKAILKEINSRYAEFQNGGIPTDRERMTAYKQEALRIAFFLKESSPLSPAQLRERGTRSDKTQQILAGNVYGWFERIARGQYCLNDAGMVALSRYESEYPGIKEKLKLP